MKHDYGDFIHFLKTGKIGQLRLGMSLAAVYDYPGQPYATKVIAIASSQRSRVSRVYGCLELRFKSAPAGEYMYAIDFHKRYYPEYGLPAPLETGWFAGLCLISYQDILDFLIDNNVAYERYERSILLYSSFVSFGLDNTQNFRYLSHYNISIKPLEMP